MALEGCWLGGMQIRTISPPGHTELATRGWCTPSAGAAELGMNLSPELVANSVLRDSVSCRPIKRSEDPDHLEEAAGTRRAECLGQPRPHSTHNLGCAHVHWGWGPAQWGVWQGSQSCCNYARCAFTDNILQAFLPQPQRHQLCRGEIFLSTYCIQTLF